MNLNKINNQLAIISHAHQNHDLELYYIKNLRIEWTVQIYINGNVVSNCINYLPPPHPHAADMFHKFAYTIKS